MYLCWLIDFTKLMKMGEQNFSWRSYKSEFLRKLPVIWLYTVAAGCRCLMTSMGRNLSLMMWFLILTYTGISSESPEIAFLLRNWALWCNFWAIMQIWITIYRIFHESPEVRFLLTEQGFCWQQGFCWHFFSTLKKQQKPYMTV